MSLIMICILLSAVFITNIIGVLSGFGLSTILLPLFVLFMPFAQAVVLTAIIHWFHDIGRIGFFIQSIDWNIVWFFGIASIIGSFIGSLFLVEAQLLTLVLGFILFLWAIWSLYKPHYAIPVSPFNLVLGGVISGFLAGIIGIRGPIKGAFLVSYHLSAASYIATMGFISILIDSTRIMTYFARGIFFEQELWFLMPFFIIVTYLGSYIGKLYIQKISQKQFQRMVAYFIAAEGIFLIVNYFLSVGYKS